MTVQVSYLEAILTEIEAIDYAKHNDPAYLNEWLVKLSGYMAFSGQQVANAQKLLNQAKARAYETYVFSREASGLKVIPSLAKEYVAVKCDSQEYEFDVAERCNRTCTHTIHALQTVVSALKEELKIVKYQNYQP